MSKSLLILTASLVAIATPAQAQRTDDNAVKEAEDAFGTSVGDENIGLYTPFEVRGFSAIDAGNVRIDGLYFDRQTDPSFHLVEGSTIRVGISAQGYPLPAPTGIVDYRLRRAGDKQLISPVIGFGPFGTMFGEVDVQLPLIAGKLGVAMGTSFYNDEFENGVDRHAWSASIAPRWRPREDLEVIPFFSRTVTWDEEAAPLIFVSGPHLPPRVKRGRFYGQEWTDLKGVSNTYGAAASGELGEGLTLRAGAFHSAFEGKTGFADLFLETDADGSADHVIIADPNQNFSSTSGELRLSKAFDVGKSRHVVHLIGRARDQKRRYGGSDVRSFGRATIGVREELDEPDFVFGPQTRDHVRQWTGALAYEGRWTDLVELSAGIQKSSYRKTVTQPGEPEPQLGKDSPWLYNVAVALHPASKLAFYGSYTTGLEEGGIAPENAVNKQAAAPAIITKQWDAGLRYAFTPTLKLVAGVFDVRKPYYNLDSTSFYRRLGQFRQRGVEMSLAGTPVKGLNVVAGAVFLDPRVTGEEVENGSIGKKPVGQTDRLIIISADYELPEIKGVSINTGIVSVGDRMASSDNQLAIPARTVVDIGTRYRFKLGKAPATLSIRMGNIFNTFGWRTNSSAVFVPNAQRRLSVSLAADF